MPKAGEVLSPIRERFRLVDPSPVIEQRRQAYEALMQQYTKAQDELLIVRKAHGIGIFDKDSAFAQQAALRVVHLSCELARVTRPIRREAEITVASRRIRFPLPLRPVDPFPKPPSIRPPKAA